MTQQPGADGRRPDGSYPTPRSSGPRQPPGGYGPGTYGPGQPYGPGQYGPPHQGAPRQDTPPNHRTPPHQGPPHAGPPQAGPPQPGAPQQGYGPPPGGGAAQPAEAPRYAAGSPPPPLQKPPKKKGRGGRIALIVVAVVLVVLVGGGYLAYRALSGFVGDVTGGASIAGAGTGCSFVTAEDVDGTLGGTYELVELGGLGDFAGVALDSRVLAQAPTCWGVDQSTGKLVRIARYEGADAADVFAAEKQTAQGSSQDQGDGVTVSTEGYLGEDVAAGDEAFCTTGDFTAAAGALVRTGDKLVYVSTTAAGDGAESVPQIDLSGEKPGFATDADNCRLSADVASKVS